MQGQQKESAFVDANYFYGSILRHNKDIEHLIKGHPKGFILGYNVKTFGKSRWQQAYNYPDFGVSMVYQNPQNDVLGSTISIHGHYNFYFLKRNLFLRVATGIAYAENPYDIDTNPNNNAYGTHLLGSSYFMLGYQRKDIFKGFGLKAGLALIHYSNSSVKSPNSSANTFAATLGVNYQIDAYKQASFIKTAGFEKIKQPIHLNLVLRGGIQEGRVIGLGQKPFVVVSAYADKRLSFKSESTIRMRTSMQHAVRRMIIAGVPESRTLGIQIRRTNLLADSISIARKLREEDLRKPLQIKFHQEAGIDAGGVKREYFALLVEEAFDPNYGRRESASVSWRKWKRPPN